MYDFLAHSYDRLTDDVGYEKRTDYLCSLFERFDRLPALLLDLACGTGGFSNCFAKRGASVIGVDISEEMLARAAENSREMGLEVLYLCQDATELDLYGTVDGAVCCLDSLNHLIDYDDFAAAIARVALFLEKDRLFIFDLNTEYKHSQVLGDNTFVIDDEGIYCVWQNEYDGENGIVDIALDVFNKAPDGSYTRESELIAERAYTEKEVAAALKSAGLEILAIYGDMTTAAPSNTEERVIYVTKRI